MGNDRRLAWISAVAVAGGSGLVAGLALPPLGWPWLLWPALAVLWGRAGSPPVPSGSPPAPLGGLLWGLAAVLVSHRWLLWLHPLDWIGVPGPLSLPLCLLLWLLCGVLGGLLVMGWSALVRWLDPARPSTALIGACLWGLAEVALSGGPLFWLGLGASALPGDGALAGVAALGGAGMIAALQLLVGWCLWRALALPLQRRCWGAVAVALVVAAHLAGEAALALAPGPAGPPQRLLVLQPAIPTRSKFEDRQQQRLLSLLASAQRLAAGGEGPDPAGPDPGSPARAAALLLPEGSLVTGQPLPLPAGGEVLSGGFRRQGEEQRSSVLRFGPGRRLAGGWIDKHRVVPLGEWVPLAGLLRWSGLSAVGGIEPGPPSRLLPRPAGPIGVAICYEISDGAALAAATRAGAQWLLATANLDPYPLQLQGQFLALARLRAIETGRWLVSAANTGPSVLVDGTGRLRERLPPQIATSGWMAVEPRTALTPYARWGEAPLLALLLLAGLVRLRKVQGSGSGSPPP
jgi:apolipoprotein N-acyltransferase